MLYKLEIVYVKHYAPNHMLVHNDGALFQDMGLKLVAILLTILYQLTKFKTPSDNNFLDILITFLLNILSAY